MKNWAVLQIIKICRNERPVIIVMYKNSDKSCFIYVSLATILKPACGFGTYVVQSDIFQDTELLLFREIWAF